MDMSEQESIRVRNRFIRYRNVLLSEADFAPLFSEFDRHLRQYGQEIDASHREIFQSCLAAFTLHCASHPRNETLAWTLSFQDPLLNVFLGGDTQDGNVVGRVFIENVKVESYNSFYQELVVRGKPLHRSFVEFEGHDPLIAAETYYARSEQRPARFFKLSDSRFVMLGAHPDFEEDWFSALTHEDVEALEATETLVDIESRDYGWFCGCNDRRIFQVLENVVAHGMEELFQEDPSVTVQCPRCAAKYIVTREAMEAHMAEIEKASLKSPPSES